MESLLERSTGYFTVFGISIRYYVVLFAAIFIAWVLAAAWSRRSSD